MKDIEELKAIKKYLDNNSYSLSRSLYREERISMMDIQNFLETFYIHRRNILDKNYILNYVSSFINMSAIYRNDKRNGDQLVGIDYEIESDNRQTYYQYTFHFRSIHFFRTYFIKIMKIRKSEEKIAQLSNNHEEEEEYDYHLVSSSLPKKITNKDLEDISSIYMDELEFIDKNKKMTTLISNLEKERNCYQEYDTVIRKLTMEEGLKIARIQLLEEANLYLSFELVNDQIIVYRDNGQEQNRELSILMNANTALSFKNEFFGKLVLSFADFQTKELMAVMSIYIKNAIRLREKEDNELTAQGIDFISQRSSGISHYDPIRINTRNVDAPKTANVIIHASQNQLDIIEIRNLLDSRDKLYFGNGNSQQRHRKVNYEKLEPIDPVKLLNSLSERKSITNIRVDDTLIINVEILNQENYGIQQDISKGKRKTAKSKVKKR